MLREGLFVGVLIAVCSCAHASSQLGCLAPGKNPGTYHQPSWPVYHIGMRIVYGCNGNNMVINGSFESYCLSSRTWSSDPPTCVDAPLAHRFGCNRLEDPVNGKVRSTPQNKVRFENEESVRIVCDSGYKSEENESICIGGTWTYEPVCKRIFTCLTRPPPIDGSYIPSQQNTTTWNLGDIARFVCSEGYFAFGAQLSVCRTTGWSRSVPTCRAICPHRAPPTNGYYTFYQALKKTWYSGDVARYRCRVTYQLRGSPTSRCLSNGTWSTDLPKCVGKKTCPFRSPPVDGAYDSIEKRRWRVGSRALFRCDRNLHMIGNRSSTCLESGKWSSRVPSCQVIQRDNIPLFCKRPKDPSNGKVQSYPLNKLIFRQMDIIEVKCNFGFISSADDGLVLCFGGEWKNFPTCISTQVPCGYRKPPKHGDYDCANREKTSWSKGETARFQCDCKYKLSGSRESTCRNNGVWSSPVPSCIPEHASNNRG